VIRYLGYKPYEKELIQFGADLNLGTIGLIENPEAIDEVKVVGRSPLAKVRGDTMEYNAEAFKVNPDADTEDLLKKMPGVSQTQSPGIGQLQNTIDNSNPLKLTTGNPDLKESYRHNLFMRYSSSDISKARIFFIMGRITLADNYITNHTIYAFRDSVLNNSVTLQQGSQLTVPVNLDNYWNATVFTTYGFPISLIKSNLNINLSYNYSHRPGMINNNTNYSNDNRFGAGLVLSSNISEKVDFSVSSNTSYNIANNTLYQELNDEYIYQKTGANLNLIFWKGMVFNTRFSHQYYSGLSKGYDESYYLWNLSLGKKLFQNQQAEIKLSVYDVLNQNKSVSRDVTDAYIEDTRTNVLQRYFMLSFRYNLRNFGSS